MLQLRQAVHVRRGAVRQGRLTLQRAHICFCLCKQLANTLKNELDPHVVRYRRDSEAATKEELEEEG